MSVYLKAELKPISYIKKNAADMVKYVNVTRSPIVFTQNGENAYSHVLYGSANHKGILTFFSERR